MVSMGLERNPVHYNCGHLLAYCIGPGSQHSWMNDWQGKRKFSEKTCPSVALCTMDPQTI
jgi:hypothetical protein